MRLEDSQTVRCALRGLLVTLPVLSLILVNLGIFRSMAMDSVLPVRLEVTVPGPMQLIFARAYWEHTLLEERRVALSVQLVMNVRQSILQLLICASLELSVMVRRQVALFVQQVLPAQ